MTRDVNELADRWLEGLFETFPHYATMWGAALGPHDRLPEHTPEARARWEALEDSILASLEAIDPGELPADSAAALTHGFLRELIRNDQAYRVCAMHLWNVSPAYSGWQQEMAQLAGVQPVGTPEQNEAAWRRFSELPRYIDQEILNLREGLRNGYSAPKHNVRGVIAQLEAMLAAPVERSPFVAMAPDSVPEFRAKMAALVVSSIRPAIARYHDFLEAEYLSAAREDIAIAANPNGAAGYEAAIEYYATISIAPNAVHATGLEQGAAIRAGIEDIARRSFGETDVARALNRLRSDPGFLLGSREQLLDISRAAVERARAAVPAYFGNVPRAGVEVRPVPEFAEAGAPAGFYNAGAEDGSRPGVYFINLRDAAKNSRAGVEATAFHETYPGHHLQCTIALEREGLHAVQRYVFLSGFGEGWALYAERLADEMGLYTSDVDRIGLLSNEAFRAARLVVDAGIHALGWTRDRAIDYMLSNTAESRSAIEAEVDRYIAVPGQATSYMLGNLEIRKLRDEASAALGDRFDLRTFHDRVLENGTIPLSMLRRRITRWIGPAQG